MPDAPKRVLVLCSANSVRSQMAEGVLRHYGGGRLEAHSAGTRPTIVNPLAMRLMSEIGIDITKQRAKHVDEYKDAAFDVVVTVCHLAREKCPPAYFPGARRLHWEFPEPPSGINTTPEMMAEFRRVRDLIHERFRKAAEEGFDSSLDL